jgi:AraC-like DNA-binding protein/ligand-binding sensor protein
MPRFKKVASAFMGEWGICCILTDIDGNCVAGESQCSNECIDKSNCRNIRSQAIREAVRWGEPSLLLCPQNYVTWAVPVMDNMHVIGGILATNIIMGNETNSYSPRHVRLAMDDLLRQVIAENLTNPALLELHSIETARESEKAEAIHELKGKNYQSIRDIYLVDESSLITAIKTGERATAREILNRILVGIYFLGRERQDLLKSFLLELVIMMSRSAVEAGADPTQLLGTNYSSFAELARINSEEELCAWVVKMLENAMDAISTHHKYPISALISSAVTYIQEHLDEELTRDMVSECTGLSATHFSRLLKQTYGHSFTDFVLFLRIERAREMLVRTEKSIVQICMECGFNDQSYFTRAFQKRTGRPPGEYRKYKRSHL